VSLVDRVRGLFQSRATQLTYDQIANAIDGLGGR
jgi:hypothetical protein